MFEKASEIVYKIFAACEYAMEKSPLQEFEFLHAA